MEKNFDKDEIMDSQLIKEGVEKNKDYASAMKWISERLVKRYGAEFGGTLAIEYDRIDNKFILKYGTERREFEEDELGLIPAEIKFLRKLKNKK